MSFAQADSWVHLIGSPAGQIHSVLHSTHKRIAKKVLCSHVGLFMCVCECVFNYVYLTLKTLLDFNLSCKFLYI